MAKVVGDYTLDCILGSGQFGKVFKARHTKYSNFFAIKAVKRNIFDENPKLKEFTINEIRALTKINNDYVVKFIEMIKTNHNIYFVYEFCNGGTLEDDLLMKGHYSEKEAKEIFQQIVKGLDSVIKLNIIHRDIKPQNILFHNGRIKIADFGFCKPMETRNQMTKTVLGSPIYMAPEILRGEDYTMKADIWSLGVLYYEMLYGKCPYEGKNILNLINLIEETELYFDPYQKISLETQSLLREMLSKDPKKRAEWEKVYKTIVGVPCEPPPILKEIREEKKSDFQSVSPQKSEQEFLSYDSIPNEGVSPNFTKFEAIKHTTKKVLSTAKNPSEDQLLKNNEQQFFAPLSAGMPQKYEPISANFSPVKGKNEKRIFSGFAELTNKNINMANQNNFNINISPEQQLEDFAPPPPTISAIHEKIVEKNVLINNDSEEKKKPKNRDSLHESFLGKSRSSKSEKMELIFNKIYKIHFNEYIEKTEKLFQKILKERNKLVFLSKIFHQLALLNKDVLSEERTKYLLVFFHKYLYHHALNFKEAFFSEFTFELGKSVKDFNKIKVSIEFKRLEALSMEEVQKIFDTYKLHRSIFLDSETTINNFRLEIQSLNFFDLKFFVSKIVEAIENINESANINIRSQSSIDKSMSCAILCNALLDSILINELFENFVNGEVDFESNKYFEKIEEFNLADISQIVNFKKEFLKNNFNF